jgi:RNA polymerase sigma-70 factor, ECF subfamily
MSTENVLLRKAQQFDRQALAQIYDRYSPKLYQYAVRQLGDPEQAEECVAETFDRFLRALYRGGGPKKYLQAYLYRVAHNWITDLYRRQPLPELPLSPDLIDKSQAAPFDQAVYQFEKERIQVALSRLTPDQRQVIVLKYLQGLNNREISLAVGKTIGAIKALQHRGLAALRRILLEEENTYEQTRG